MRSRRTNVLQTIVLLTGIIYIVLGLLFYFTPLMIFRVFAESVSENWWELVRDNELVGPLYSVLRAFAALVFTTGLTNIMPLFDPLKYRLLVYFNGLIFPAMGVVIFAAHSIGLMMRSGNSTVLAENTFESGSNHIVILVMAAAFLGILLFNTAGILITRPEAKEGIE